MSSIGRYAFYGTPWYDNQPDGLVYAGNVAYAYKGNMPQNTSIYIKEGTTSITGYAFDNCSSLVSVIIPTTVKSIGNWAFADCSDLIDVYCYARKGPTASDGIFNNSGIQFATLHVPETSVNGYRTTTPWSGFGNIVALQDNDPKPDSEPESEPEPTPEYIRGDVNLDGIVNGTDIQEVINIIVNGDSPDEEYEKAGVRFGFYETIPGYSVKINSINIEGISSSVMGSDAIGYTIGTTFTNSTFDKADKGFSNVYLTKAIEKPIVIKLDYTLISDDGSGEKIAVKDAVITIPTQYIQWMPNYNYTYIFKMYDNSNTFNWGDTPVSDIYPASFDAVVVANADGSQQTIISITTR